MKNQTSLSDKKQFSDIISKYVLLHILLLVYAMAAFCSKLASSNSFLSAKFIWLYGAVLVLLVVYAIGWQQVLKKMPLSIAFVNKSIVVIWGFIIGAVFLNEKITIGMLIGSVLVIAGIIFVVSENE